MLIDFDEIIEVLFKSGTFNEIKGVFYIGAHDCEEIFFSNVYYPQHNLDKIWYGKEMLSINGWNEVVN